MLPVFALNRLNIPTVNQSKHLGIIISEKKCAPDLERQMRKIYANVNMSKRTFSKCSPHVLFFVFKSYSSNLYRSILWYDYFKTA